MSDVNKKFKDIISRSSLIHSGPPARYQLVTKRESLDGERGEESRLRRWTFGERDHSKVNKTILLVGETGTGKSTMINALVNYVMGVEMEDKVWFEIVEEGGRSQSESQTSEVIVYQICGFEEGRVPFSLTIIDTPGYGLLIVSKLLHLFTCGTKKVQQIDAVGVLLKSSTNRVDDRQKYVFNEVDSLFGKDMENNIVFLITHSDGIPPTDALQAIEDADIKCAKDETGKPVHFLFNNSKKDFITKETEKVCQSAWTVTKTGIEELFIFLKDAVPPNIQVTINVLWEKKFQDIISRSSPIHPGPPARYQLVTKRESLDGERGEESRLRRWTFGERDHSKVNKTILLVGETGTGKSTMINTLVNYVMGVEMEDKVWFEIVEEGGRSLSESQTSEVTVYQICGFEEGRVPFSLTIIDTPGYGLQIDIASKLLNLFTCGAVQQIDAVFFFVKFSTNRVDDRQKYIFDEVDSLFGKDMENNIVFLITHSDGMPATNTLKVLEGSNIKCAKDHQNQAVHFLFNNRQTFYTPEHKNVLEQAWETTDTGMKKLSSFLKTAQPQGLQVTVDVLKERIRLECQNKNNKERTLVVEEACLNCCCASWLCSLVRWFKENCCNCTCTCTCCKHTAKPEELEKICNTTEDLHEEKTE